MCVALLAGSSAIAACGSSSSSGASGGSCTPAHHEQLDSRSLQHVLPGSPTPSYLTNPPTSGPHQPAPPVEGVQNQAIPAPVQVGILEAGHVILQHNGIDAKQNATLQSLASDTVVVAPNPDLPSGQVVATAWVWKQACKGVDRAALMQFIHDHEGHGPSNQHAH